VNGNVVPEQKGQVTFKIEQGHLFLVSGFCGNPNLGFMSLCARKAEFYHTGKANAVDRSQTLDLTATHVKLKHLCIDMVRGCVSDMPRFGYHLKRTIFPSEDGMLLTPRSDTGSNDGRTEMISMGIRIERDPIKHVKTFKVALGIKDGTLNHSVSLPNRSWFTQLLDFFDVRDTPISGYMPSTVVTELHLHLWNCAINYA